MDAKQTNRNNETPEQKRARIAATMAANWKTKRPAYAVDFVIQNKERELGLRK